MTKGALALGIGICLAIGITLNVLVVVQLSRAPDIGSSSPLSSWPYALHGGKGLPIRQIREGGLGASRDVATWRAENEWVPSESEGGDQSKLYYERVWSYGLPFRSIGSCEWYDFSTHGGVGTPLRPLWPGFALNTIFYAALAWGVWQVPLAIRRRQRRARGECVRCGYALARLPAGSPCPECGTSFADR